MLMNGGRYERYEDKEFEVKDDELVVIGREKHRGLVKVERKSKTIRVIINDPYQYVSRTHCVMYWCNGRWFVKDFSQNGTWVMDPTGSRRTYVRGESSKPVEVNNGDYLLLAYVTPNQPYVTIIFEYK
jgi:pSer/pThr/pTyr-binding forkhead associated (FHA) protein